MFLISNSTSAVTRGAIVRGVGASVHGATVRTVGASVHGATVVGAGVTRTMGLGVGVPDDATASAGNTHMRRCNNDCNVMSKNAYR